MIPKSLPSIFGCAVLFILCSGLEARAEDSSSELASAYDAYVSGDYEKALQEFKSAAESGNITAQDSLGVMYANGEGGPGITRVPTCGLRLRLKTCRTPILPGFHGSQIS
jgi:hypothetical protein